MKIKMIARGGFAMIEHYAIDNANIRWRICGTWAPCPVDQRIWESSECHVEKGDVVVEVGADVGVYAIHAGREGAAQYVGFEPHPANYECAKHNSALGRPGFGECVTLFPFAVSDCCQFAPLYTGNGITANGLIDRGNGENSIRVRTVTLDWLFGQKLFDYVDCLKIDCNGEEAKVFDGLSPSNLAKVRKIAIQYHHVLDNLRPGWVFAIQKRFREAGFTTKVKGINEWGDCVILAWRKP
jgi:FkbM family methyltransferase